MQTLTKTLATTLALVGMTLVGSMALADDEAKDPTVIAWKALMGKNGAAAKVLGEMAGGKTAFDAAAATAARDTLVADAKDIPTVFKTEASDPAAKAKPDIWTNWDDFTAKAAALGTAAAALDTTSLESLQAGMGAVGGACKACHSAYKGS